MEINGAEQRTQGRTHTNMHNWFLTNTQKQLSGGRSLSNRLTQLTLTGRKTSLTVYIKINAKWTTGVKYKTTALLEKSRGKSSGLGLGRASLHVLDLTPRPQKETPLSGTWSKWKRLFWERRCWEQGETSSRPGESIRGPRISQGLESRTWRQLSELNGQTQNGPIWKWQARVEGKQGHKRGRSILRR